MPLELGDAEEKRDGEGVCVCSPPVLPSNVAYRH